MMKVIPVSEVVQVAYVGPMTVGEDTLEYRVEIVRRAGGRYFGARVWLIELFEVNAPFGPEGIAPVHATLLMEDSLPWRRLRATTPERALARVVDAMEALYGIGQSLKSVADVFGLKKRSSDED